MSDMNYSLTGILGAALGLAFLSQTAVAETANDLAQSPRSAMLAQTCAGCHGTQGYLQNSAFMPLAGMPTTQFVTAMKSFANGSRPSTVMGPLAKAFSEDEIKAMAAYFAQFPKNEAQ
ncbi:c-type cytochrome [Halothiobacillus sp.]|uniref:c-type cytochrome n=1 Tax=Halothiobacillus sp. TaxID=1891311 RepID=UPI00261BCCA1|nr:c-type cytochrome [Halothiobacillus sp.]MDD3575891.1 c-type cytochrome [Halothiobacillus sp.]MDD4966622.1 c-type cytochrome [Halothiobacillus sp.]